MTEGETDPPPTAAAPGRNTRPAAVAGAFYPGSPSRLGELVDRLLDSVEVAAGEPAATGYVVPHAGYRFSGPVAAQVYARMRAHAGAVDRVVLVGPAHFVRLRGCAVSTVDSWATPLGEVPLDTAGGAALVDAGLAAADDAPHAPEHSLEVQLPFLQRALGQFRLLPIAVGVCDAAAVRSVLAAAAPELAAGTVVVCSTDLSHYHDQATAQELDRRTAQAVLDLAPDRIGLRDACGVFALRGTLSWARDRGLAPDLLDLRTSADTAGDPSRVVGYPAFTFRN